MKRSKRASILNKTAIHIILVGVIFVLFFAGVSGGINNRGVKQQVLEKQTALLIDAGAPGMRFEIAKQSLHGVVQLVELREGKVFIVVDGLVSIRGYPYFSKYSVSVEEEDSAFVIVVR